MAERSPADEELDALMRDVASAPQAEPILPGSIIDKYVIEERIGQGGMGAVFRARQQPLNRAVALKVMRLERRDAVGAAERFRREAELLSTISHPHVVTLLDFGVHTDGSLFCVMELLAGRDLRTLIERAPVPIKDALMIARDVASALQALHAAGIVHRDLKPGNIFLVEGAGREPFARVLDFGIAKQLDADGQGVGERLTGTGSVVGTVGYVAPETVLQEGPVTPAVDMYALGVVLFQMLAGRPPFEASNTVALMLMHANAPAPALKSMSPSVSDDVASFAESLLRKDPALRPDATHAVQLLDALLVAEANRATARPEQTATETREREPRVERAVTSPTPEVTRAPALDLKLNDGDNGPARVTESRSSTRKRGVLFAALCTLALSSGVWLARRSPADESCLGSLSRNALAQVLSAERLLADGDVTASKEAWQEVLSEQGASPAAKALAHTRLAALHIPDNVNAAHPHFSAALQARPQLCARDQLLIDALEPLMRASVAPKDAAVRFASLRARFPKDVDVGIFSAQADLFSGDIESARTTAQGLLADTNDARVFVLLSRLEGYAGNSSAQARALKDCTEKRPLAHPCWEERALLLADKGQCQQALDDLETIRVRFEKSVVAPSERAVLLVAQGARPDSVEPLVTQATQRANVETRLAVERDVRSRIAFARGDFAELIRLAETTEQESDPVSRSRAALRLLVALHEIDTWDAADKLARKEIEALALSPPSLYEEGAEVAFAAARLRDGTINDRDLVGIRDRWVSRVSSRKGFLVPPLTVWAAEHGFYGRDELTASAALDALKALGPPPEPDSVRAEIAATIGSMYLYAGHPKEAVPYLARADRECGRMVYADLPYASMKLGFAHKFLHDDAASVRAFEKFLARWGHAKPKSVSAAAARDEVDDLKSP